MECIALDDEAPGLVVVEKFCQEVPYLRLVKTFTKPKEALKYLQQFPVDLLFLDIQMPTQNGIDFFRQVKSNTMVIFTTAYSQYAVEGFNLQAVDYLLKPFTLDRFKQAASRAKDFYEFQHARQGAPVDHFFVRADYSLIKISFADILFIEGLDDYLRIHLHNQKPVVTRMTMKGILDKLPAEDFVRIHRSFIIPFNRIVQVNNKRIKIGEKELPIGSSYEGELRKHFRE